MNKYIVKRDAEQRGTLERLIASGQAPAHRLLYARTLLKAKVNVLPHMARDRALETDAYTFTGGGQEPTRTEPTPSTAMI